MQSADAPHANRANSSDCLTFHTPGEEEQEQEGLKTNSIYNIARPAYRADGPVERKPRVTLTTVRSDPIN